MCKHLLLPVVALVLCSACTRSYKTPEDLLHADSLSESANPEKASVLLETLADKYSAGDEYLRNKYMLLCVKAKDKRYIPIDGDSVTEHLATYFAEYGTEEDKLESLYYLGGFYRDNHDYPRALDAYNEAATFGQEHLDAIKTDVLAVIYSQLAAIYVEMEQFPKALACVKKKYGLFAESGKKNVDAELEMGRLYSYLAHYDSARTYYLEAFASLPPIPRTEREVMSYGEVLSFLAMSDMGTNVADSCMRILNRYAPTTLPQSVWSAKAEYHRRNGNADSMAYFLRLFVEKPRSASDLQMCSRDLYIHYREAGKKDSALHYADIYRQVSDSLIRLRNRQSSINADNFFHYRKHHEEELALEQRSSRLYTTAWMVASLLFLLSTLYLIWYIKLSSRMKKDKETNMKLRKRAQRYEKKFLAEKELRLSDNPNVAELRELLRSRAYENPLPPVDELWTKMYRIVDSEFPAFKSNMDRYNERLSRDSYQLCYLLKIGLKSADISRLYGCARSTITRKVQALERELGVPVAEVIRSGRKRGRPKKVQ